MLGYLRSIGKGRCSLLDWWPAVGLHPCLSFSFLLGSRECHHWHRSKGCLHWQPMFHQGVCQWCLVQFGQCPCPNCQGHPEPRRQIYCSPLAAGTCLIRKASEQPVSGVRRCVDERGTGPKKGKLSKGHTAPKGPGETEQPESGVGNSNRAQSL